MCGSANLTWETQATAFPSVAAALTEMKKAEELNIATRLLLDSLGQTKETLLVFAP